MINTIVCIILVIICIIIVWLMHKDPGKNNEGTHDDTPENSIEEIEE